MKIGISKENIMYAQLAAVKQNGYAMKTYKITTDEIDEMGYYTGDLDFTEELDGHLEIGANLGWVRFKTPLIIRGFCLAKFGTSIKAAEDIKAGRGIEVGESIEAIGNIKSGGGIKSGAYIKAIGSIEAIGNIKSGWGIEAIGSIEAGGVIKSNRGIKSGESINAGLPR